MIALSTGYVLGARSVAGPSGKSGHALHTNLKSAAVDLPNGLKLHHRVIMEILMAAKQQSEFNFEEALQELERLVSSMEEGELSLEDSMKAFEKGIKLTRECQTALQKAEQKVQILLNESGETQAFDVEDEG